MANYRITCTRLDAFKGEEPKLHIVAVGTGRVVGRFDTLWGIDEVLHAMDHGHVFYTRGERSGKIALVESVVCPTCFRTFIRSKPASPRDANLENLPFCEEYYDWGREREPSFSLGNIKAPVGEGLLQAK